MKSTLLMPLLFVCMANALTSLAQSVSITGPTSPCSANTTGTFFFNYSGGTGEFEINLTFADAIFAAPPPVGRYYPNLFATVTYADSKRIRFRVTGTASSSLNFAITRGPKGGPINMYVLLSQVRTTLWLQDPTALVVSIDGPSGAICRTTSELTYYSNSEGLMTEIWEYKAAPGAQPLTVTKFYDSTLKKNAAKFTGFVPNKYYTILVKHYCGSTLVRTVSKTIYTGLSCSN